ncbi:phage holin family protein [Sphingomonas sp. PAMC 26621]|uniref:phage holin family protein n=1 Tax=Sphingomonas sp. PAMC 26621 TaxID=1112213 RepID=UPI0009DA314F
MKLARAEFDEKLQGLIAGAISLVGGALVAFAGLVVLLEGGAAILARWIPTWASLLIVGALCAHRRADRPWRSCQAIHQEHHARPHCC